MDRLLWCRPPDQASPANSPLPLHVKDVAPLSMGPVLRLASLGLRTELEEALQYIAPSFLSALCTAPTEFETSRTEVRDIDALLAAGFIEPIDPARVRRWGVLFTVDEQEKNRRRPIFWPKQLNEEVQGCPTPLLGDGLIEAATICQGSHAACFDLTNSFMQVQLPPDSRPYFAFSAHGTAYAYCRLPMGYRTAPAIMHAVTKILAQSATCTVVRTTSYVDNVRFCAATQNLVLAASARFRAACLSAAVTLNDEESNAPHREGEFLGVSLDYKDGLACLGRKSLRKLVPPTASMTADEILRLFGACCHCSRVLRLPMSPYFFVFKFLRRRFASLLTAKPEEKIDVWPSILPLWRGWVERLRANNKVAHFGDSPPAETVLATDASLIGWGGVAFINGEAMEVGARWGQKEAAQHINVLEILALARALQAVPLPSGPLLLLLDNTAALHVLRKGHAREADLNHAARQVQALLGDRDVRVAYVPSAGNPADPASRGLATSTSGAALRALGRCLGVGALRVATPALPSVVKK